MTADWPRAVVFDLDGTLIDSAGDIADCLNAALAAAGLATFAESDVVPMIGGGARVLVERALTRLGRHSDAALMDKLHMHFARRYGEIGAGRSQIFAGGIELLSQLSDGGVRLGICTNKPHQITVRTLSDLGISRFFTAVVGETPALPRKPDPAMLLAAIGGLGAAVSEAVMVGDSAADVGAARAAGVPVVAVSFGYTTTPAAEIGADGVIDRLCDLPAALAALRP